MGLTSGLEFQTLVGFTFLFKSVSENTKRRVMVNTIKRSKGTKVPGAFADGVLFVIKMATATVTVAEQGEVVRRSRGGTIVRSQVTDSLSLLFTPAPLGAAGMASVRAVHERRQALYNAEASEERHRPQVPCPLRTFG